jgi:hypothetical protein
MQPAPLEYRGQHAVDGAMDSRFITAAWTGTTTVRNASISNGKLSAITTRNCSSSLLAMTEARF